MRIEIFHYEIKRIRRYTARTTQIFVVKLSDDVRGFPSFADPYLAPADPATRFTPIATPATPPITSFDTLPATGASSSSQDTAPFVPTSEHGPALPSSSSNKRNHEENDDRVLKRKRNA
jgi:hypothetical protein